MSITRNSFKRPVALFAAAAILVGAVAPVFVTNQKASAAQLTFRSIQLSDSGPSGNANIPSGVGSGTSVAYKIKFTTAAAVQSFVVDFCSASPLINDTCTAPTDLDVSTASLTANGTWSLGTLTAGHLEFTNTSSQSAGAFTFEVTGITNPSTLGSFYGRITTYANATYGTYASAASTGNYVDYGGVAMSTVNTITVTARVMEQLSLCTSGGVAVTNANNLTAASSCGSATAPAITLGSSPDYVLGYTGATPSSANIYTQLSTNASQGYALYLRAANTSCAGGNGGLSRDGGTNCEIPPINSGAATSIAFTNNTAEFGAFVSNGTAATGGTGANTAVARWSGAGSTYIMDTATANDNVISTYGSKIAETSGGDPKQANSVNNTITFAAVASPTTPAGIYSEYFSLIGVGTF
ncbi:hypothetical protein IPL85_00650 [Candidatus Saccharibacteria bacterium]|nr:MAG: hypothetical protein IPL85_00650 [Candidatus Saccharibacteria bacterium]